MSKMPCLMIVLIWLNILLAACVPSATPVPTAAFTLTPSLAPTVTPTLPIGMALIPAGPFQMGSIKEDYHEPVHTVILNAFLMDKYEVTNADYAKCVTAKKCSMLENPYTRGDYYSNGQYANYPVLYVSWEEAKMYCEWRGARLPTEAEWEKAARGGLEGKLYPWGDTAPVCTPGAENGAQFGSCSVKDAVAVGSFKPNGYGLYDMVGNVSEWVNDWYNENYYSFSPSENPPGPTKGRDKVLRGGGWQNDGFYSLRVAARYGNNPVSFYSGSAGIRCVATLESSE